MTETTAHETNTDETNTAPPTADDVRNGASQFDAVVAVYDTEDDLTTAIKHLEKSKIDMASISVLGKGMTEDRHVVGFETPNTRIARWARWGGLWGWIFGAFVFVPGVGHVAVGGYLLYLLFAGGIGAATGAVGGAFASIGIPEDGIPVYEADLRADHFLVIAHGAPTDVERIRELLTQTTHSRLDLHQATHDAS